MNHMIFSLSIVQLSIFKIPATLREAAISQKCAKVVTRSEEARSDLTPLQIIFPLPFLQFY